MIKIRHLFITVMVLFLCACAAKKPYLRYPNIIKEETLSDRDIDYEIFLVGNIGDATNTIDQSNIVDLIKAELKTSDIPQSVILLGNSISEEGFPESKTEAYQTMDLSLRHCVETLNKGTDKLYFIPGNREWFDGDDYRVSSVQKVEKYVQEVAGDNIFVPSHGCGEPKKVKLTDQLLLIIIDSQWILQGDKSQERSRRGCEVNTEEELIVYVQDILAKNKNKNVIIAAHHPVYSNGETGGNQPLSNQLLPFPVLGSIVSGVKKINGGPQRFGHPEYEDYREVVDDMLDDFEGVIFAASHENNLQSHFQEDNHYIIAGGGEKNDFVRKAGTAEFAYMKSGFAKITHTKDLELWLEFYVPDPNNPLKAKAVYQELLYKKTIIDYTDTTVYKPLSEYPDTQKTVASTIYKDKKIGMGDNYRMEWSTEVNAPVFLLEEFSGGVTIVRQGGGLETRSLRLEDEQGHQWVIRTIDKNIEKVVPRILRKTFAKTLVQDGISSAHPYAAIAIPKLAKAANIYHANPKFVWLPRQKALEDYNPVFGDKFYLLEERPGGNMEGHPDYGDAKESISTIELLEKTAKNHKHKVDQEYVLRARLFDLLIGDWDRDGDQWRWGLYPDTTGKKTIYRAIPRDRDQAFFKNEGFFNYIISRPYFYPELRKFEKEVDYLPGLVFDGGNFDRHFLSQLNKEDFIRTAQELQTGITDEVIESALRDWPEQIYELSGPEIAEKLKYRRDQLVKNAEVYYTLLTEEVTIPGTNGLNTFDIKTLPDDQLEVKVYHLSKKDNAHLIWSRIIDGKDCEELRLYGLDGSDTFNFSGEDASSIKVRLIGGHDPDILSNNAPGLEIIVYDRADGMQLNGQKVKAKLKNQLAINSFDEPEPQLDRTLHYPFFDFYTDEGLGITYNFLFKRFGFRKNPYKSSHHLNLGFYTANSAFIGAYNGHWVSVFGPNWDIKVEAEFTGPVFTQFFYGLGNEYKNFEKILNDPAADRTRFFAVRGTHVFLNTFLVRDLGSNRTFSIEPLVEFLNIKNSPVGPDNGQFIFLSEAGLTSFDFERKWYTGLGINYNSNRVYKRLLPTRGYTFNIGAKFRQSISDVQFSNLTVESSLQAYIPFSPTRKVVLATNIGAAYTFGDYEFFHANYLAGRNRLRGFKRNRFAGDGIFYHATDLRIKILQGRKGLRTGVGVFASFDYGRAFFEDDEGDKSNKIHTSYGGGFYLTPINLIGLKFGYYVGEDDTQVVVGGSLSF